MKRIEAIGHVIKELKILKEGLGGGKSISPLDFLTLSEVFKFQIEPKSDRFTAVCLDEASKIQDDEKHLKMIDDILRNELDSDESDDSEVEEVTELLDFDGSIQSSKIPPGTSLNKTMGSKKTSDDVAKAATQSGTMTGKGNYFRRYYGESVEEVIENDMSEVLGYEETKDKNAEETIEYFEKEHDMGEIEAMERAESMGKTLSLDKKGDNFQRITEKNISEAKAKKMIEVILNSRDDGGELTSNSRIDSKIKNLLRLSKAENISLEDLISKLKSY